MEKKKLGKSDLYIHPLGFGGIPIQRISHDEAEKLLGYAVEKGINFFDTARGYTDSEEKFGRGLKYYREKIVLATKTMARTKEGMIRDIDLSLKLLQTDYIDLYQCHNVRTEEDWEQLSAPGGGLEALDDAVKAGKVRYAGITGHRPDMLIKPLRSYPFVSVQFPYNYIEQENKEELLEEINKQGLGSIIMKPLAGGALIPGGPALRFLAAKGFDVIIPGMESTEQVDENLSFLSLPYSEEDEFVLKKQKAELGLDFCRRCEYCMPCPQGINIPNMFLFEGYYLRYNLADWAKTRYRDSKIRAEHCIKCGICETRCPYDLPIRDKLERVAKHLG